ncbi:MAG: hypothetical protein BroJett039_07810 [Chloroflexota bacterium]|nr:MAG: hypothetical protein BroJett039_07810 [Chloroflexota bacterium]
MDKSIIYAKKTTYFRVQNGAIGPNVRYSAIYPEQTIYFVIMSSLSVSDSKESTLVL